MSFIDRDRTAAARNLAASITGCFLCALLAAPVILAAVDPAGIPATRHAQRRAAVLEAMGEGIALLHGGDDSSTRGFRQSSDFLYLTGIDFDGAALLLVAPTGASPGASEDPQKAHDILFVVPQTDSQARWVPRRLRPGSSDEEKEAAGFSDVRDIDSLGGALRGAAAGFEGAPFDLWLSYREGTPGEPLSPALQRVDDLRRQFPQARIRNLRPMLHEMRLVKDADELERLREAIDATGAGLRAAMSGVRPGMSEMELRGLIEGGFLRAGSPRVGFSSIVGSGPNTCVLHYPAGYREMRAGELVLLDVGAEVASGYTADVTRTIPVSGTFTPRQREIYELVLAAQRAAMEKAGPGVTLREVHQAAREVIEEAGHGDDFWHGTSHWLGLDVHDVGGRGAALAPGMVFTIEPGVYLPEEAIGVRIEDDVLVTEDGVEVLSRRIPRTVEEIERAMRRR